MPFEFQVGERPGRQYRAMTRFHITEGPSGTLRPSLRGGRIRRECQRKDCSIASHVVVPSRIIGD
jgi:hypothetical protein